MSAFPSQQRGNSSTSSQIFTAQAQGKGIVCSSELQGKKKKGKINLLANVI